MANQIITNLNKTNFFNDVLKDTPLAGKVFCDFVDTYKATIFWNNLFNPKLNPKFHDIPLHLQKGVIEEFFIMHKLLLSVDIHPFKVGFSWTIVDYSEAEKAVWKPFLDETYTDMANYATTNVCFIDGVKSCFAALEQRLISQQVMTELQEDIQKDIQKEEAKIIPLKPRTDGEPGNNPI